LGFPWTDISYEHYTLLEPGNQGVGQWLESVVSGSCLTADLVPPLDTSPALLLEVDGFWLLPMESDARVRGLAPVGRE
jgi:hypothetical protein